MEKIRESFAAYFKSAGLQLPDPVPPRGGASGKGWSVRYVVLQDENGQPCLEFIANNRMTNPRHIRILNGGEIVSLPGFEEDYSYNADIPGDKEAAQARMKAHNDAVMADLKAKGLM